MTSLKSLVGQLVSFVDDDHECSLCNSTVVLPHKHFAYDSNRLYDPDEEPCVISISCAACGKGPVGNVCLGCLKCYYCSDACRKVHWKTHKHECFVLQVAPRPPSAIAAISQAIEKRPTSVRPPAIQSAPAPVPSPRTANGAVTSVAPQAPQAVPDAVPVAKVPEKETPQSVPVKEVPKSAAPSETAKPAQPESKDIFDDVVSSEIIIKLNVAQDFAPIWNSERDNSVYFITTDQGLLDTVSERINFYLATRPSVFSPRPGDYCIAQSPDDSYYYRARIISVKTDGTGYFVFFIDYGNYSEADKLKVFEIPHDLSLSKTPALVVPCRPFDDKTQRQIAGAYDRFASLRLIPISKKGKTYMVKLDS